MTKKCNECDGAICPHYAQCLQNDIKERTMTDKEVIMVNDVNVAGCEFFYIEEYKNFLDEIETQFICGQENEVSDTAFTKNAPNLHCDRCPNCFYKQLQRKEQECEEFKRDNKILLQRLTAYEEDADVQYALFSDIDRLEEKIQRLQAENEELKKYKKLFEKCKKFRLKEKEDVKKVIEENKNLKDMLKRTTCQAECYKHKEADRYKQVLEEIENICKYEVKELTNSAINGGRYIEISIIINEVLKDE